MGEQDQRQHKAQQGDSREKPTRKPRLVSEQLIKARLNGVTFRGITYTQIPVGPRTLPPPKPFQKLPETT